MLSQKQWIWCADRHKGIKALSLVTLAFLGAIYIFFFLKIFWWENKVPDQSGVKSTMKKLGCDSQELGDMFIPSRRKIEALKGNMSGYTPDPLQRHDARFLYLENHGTTVFGEEILAKRPDCIGAYIADLRAGSKAHAVLIVDRETKKTVVRITRLDDDLTR